MINMDILVDEDFLKEVRKCLNPKSAKNHEILNKIENFLEISKESEEEKEKLENQEIWIKCFYNGYFYMFKDMSINVEIYEENLNFGDEDRFKDTTTLFPPLYEKNGKIDLTPLLFTLLHKMKEKPDGKFKCYTTGFSRQMHFDKNLLSHPLPEEILKLFNREKELEVE